jgi:hypothetical protein
MPKRASETHKVGPDLRVRFNEVKRLPDEVVFVLHGIPLSMHQH